MAQRIVVECDQCIHAEAAPPAVAERVSVTVVLPGGKPQTWDVDLCEVHRKPFADLGVELDELGARPTAHRAAALGGTETRVCSICGKQYGSKSGLTGHRQRKHPEVGLRCTCGAVFATNQGVAVHVARSKTGEHARATQHA